MPLTNTTITVGLSIKITGVSGLSFNSDTSCNVKKKIANIIYINSPPPDAVLLSYVGSEQLSATTALFIGDRSNTLYPNASNNLDTEFIYTSSPVGVQHKDILVTQKFAQGSVADIPLYFKHVLPTTVQLETVKVLDKNFKEVSSDHYLVELKREYDETTGAPSVPISYSAMNVYNSLENKYNSETGEYSVYYVQYMDSWNDVKTVLLDNQPAYREATIDDIWSISGTLAPWAEAYILEASGGSYFIDLPPALNQKFAVKYLTESKIYVAPPTLTEDTALWLPRISNGSFSWRYNSLSYSFDIPEFSSQAFNPIEPYKIIDRAETTKISNNLLKLSHSNIAINGFMHPFTLVIEENGSVIYALTQDPTLVGSRYKNFDGAYVYYDGDPVVWSSSEILSIDTYSGIVQLSLTLKDYWKYYATYNYLEKFYELSSINMNPVFDREIYKYTKVIYMVPVSVANNNIGRQTRSIQYLSVAPDGVIEEASQNSSGGNEKQNISTTIVDTDAYATTGLLGMHYNWRASTVITADCVLGPSEIITVETTNKFPISGWIRIFDGTHWRYVKYDSKTETTFVLSDDDNGSGVALGHVPIPDVAITYSQSQLNKVELVNFIDEHSSNSYRNYTSEASEYGGLTGYPTCYHRYFVLADMAINPPHGVEDLTILDLREEGGNLDSEKYEEAKNHQPEAQWFKNYLSYNGQPTPGNAAVVIKLPKSILTRFTEEQIESIIGENISLGIKPIIRYYGYVPHIIYMGINS